MKAIVYFGMPSFSLLALAFVSQAHGQEPEVQPGVGDEIVVEGTPQDRKTSLDQARELTRPSRRGRPLERFDLPLCPMVWGFDDDTAAVIIERLKSNAREIGLSATDDECKKNIFIGIVEDVGSETERLVKENKWAFGNLFEYQRDRVINEAGPTRAWHVSVPGDRDGVRYPDFGGAIPITASRSASRLTANSTRLIEASVVLIERSAIVGKTLRQVADFATMRALVPVNEVDPEDDPDLDTILSLFTSAYGPAGLTDFDKAYLGAYYAGNAYALRPGSLLSSIASRFAKDLASERRQMEKVDGVPSGISSVDK